jgi:hypothetical protein
MAFLIESKSVRNKEWQVIPNLRTLGQYYKSMTLSLAYLLVFCNWIGAMSKVVAAVTGAFTLNGVINFHEKSYGIDSLNLGQFLAVLDKLKC